jgi:SEC-C motif-containing protein
MGKKHQAAAGKLLNVAACPCGGGQFEQCCGRYLEQGQDAPTPEALMRSRYSAFVRSNEAYLRASWHPSTCPDGSLIDGRNGAQWLGLDVKAAALDSADPGNKGTVEFVARYKMQGRAHRLHEVSRFVRENGRWYYLDGEFPGA